MNPKLAAFAASIKLPSAAPAKAGADVAASAPAAASPPAARPTNGRAAFAASLKIPGQAKSPASPATPARQLQQFIDRFGAALGAELFRTCPTLAAAEHEHDRRRLAQFIDRFGAERAAQLFRQYASVADAERGEAAKANLTPVLGPGLAAYAAGLRLPGRQ